jgi:hypothetical protein
MANYQAVVDVVTYIDGTADAANNAGLERIVDERKAAVASKKLAIEIIKSAMADPNDADPSATAARKIQDRATSWRGSQHTKLDLDPIVLESIANQIKTSPKRDALQQLVDREETNISMLSVHAAVVNAGGPQ